VTVKFEPYRAKNVQRWSPDPGVLLHSDVGGIFVSIQDYNKIDKANATLQEQLDAAKAENAKLENRHVQFMVEGGPVVMVADYDKLKAENDELRAKKEKIAPVQGYSAGIPWVMHLRAYDAYCKKYGPQEALISLEGRNCRGGFSTSELDVFIPGWREELSELHRLRAALDKATGPVTDGESQRFGLYMSGNEGYEDGIRLTPGQVSRLLAARKEQGNG
jgi:hypothetical protein